MIWEKRNAASTVAEAVSMNSGLTLFELLNPSAVDPSSIAGLSDAAKEIQNAVDENVPITIVGDYDCDGITATAILTSLCGYLGASVSSVLPRRITEGYGISLKTLDRCKMGLLVTVDNGIAAVDTIAEAVKRGYRVVVIDHHLPGTELPLANAIVDPHVDPDNNGFVDYCGAGLALKLCEMMTNSKFFLDKMTAFAAIGTIADVMPLIGDNRRIVKEGLKLLNDKKRISCGLRSLLRTAGLVKITETDIGFKIGPMLNAPGRMFDDGAERALRTILAEDYKLADKYAAELNEINEKRKETAASALILAHKYIEDNCLYGTAPFCIYIPGIPEGVVGIVTGKIAEEFKTPAFVFTDSLEPGQFKGSGRSYGKVNLKEVVDAAKDALVKYGGHAGAAGLSVKEEDFDRMTILMTEYLSDYVPEDSEVIKYDLEITSDKLASTYAEVQKYAPYGEGNPPPVFKITHAVLCPRANACYKTMGKENEHIKLFGNNYSIVCFGKAEDYTKLGKPKAIDVIGTVSENTFGFQSELQIEAMDFVPSAISIKKTGLRALLEETKPL